MGARKDTPSPIHKIGPATVAEACQKVKQNIRDIADTMLQQVA